MTRRTDTYTAVTPFGAVEVDFPEDGGSVFIGTEGAVEYLKDVIRDQVGQCGVGLTPESIEPIDFMGFCQPKGSGILIIEPFDNLMMYGPTDLGGDDDAPALDSVEPSGKEGLKAELARIEEAMGVAGLNPIQRARLAREMVQLIVLLNENASKRARFQR